MPFSIDVSYTLVRRVGEVDFTLRGQRQIVRFGVLRDYFLVAARTIRHDAFPGRLRGVQAAVRSTSQSFRSEGIVLEERYRPILASLIDSTGGRVGENTAPSLPAQIPAADL